MKIHVAPSILSADFGRLAEEIRAVEQAGADWIHVDVMDGRFVPNITVGPMVAKAAKAATSLIVDAHLMIAEPGRYLSEFVGAGVDFITVHAEACGHLHRTLQEIRDLGVKSGVAFNPATPIAALRHVIDLTDLVLIMSVNPGFGNQTFIEDALNKIDAVAGLVQSSGRDIRIQVDGGVGPGNAKSVRDAGADVLVAGSAVFGSDDYAKSIDLIRNH